jgi:hypothetical protein
MAQCSKIASELDLYSGAGDGNRTRTISLGTGLSCLADHSICSSETICVDRECPLQTVSDRPIGHATGTSALVRSRATARSRPVLRRCGLIFRQAGTPGGRVIYRACPSRCGDTRFKANVPLFKETSIPI